MFDFNHKRAQWLLFGSLALNLFLLGVLSVHWFGRGPLLHEWRHADHSARHGERPRGRERAHAAGGHEVLHDVVDVMGGPRDPRVHQLWQARRADQRQVRERMRSARLAVQQAMTDDPFNPQKLESALVELQKVSAEAQQRAQSGIVELARKLTPEERARLKAVP